MEVRALLDVLHIAERLKDELRHCETSRGRRESVAEHSWRLALMAFFMKDEFPALDMDKVIKMCLIHDLGECFTGDIPTFLKSASDEKKEDTALFSWVASLPAPYNTELAALYTEMGALQTDEAKLYKATSSRPSSSTMSPISARGSRWNMTSTGHTPMTPSRFLPI